MPLEEHLKTRREIESLNSSGGIYIIFIDFYDS